MADELADWRRHRPVDSARPGLGRRSVLFVRRRPALVVTAACALLLGGTVVGVGLRDQALQLRSERMGHQLAQQELDVLKARGREAVRQVAVFTNLIPSSSPSGNVLPVMVWLEWLTSKTVVSDMGEVETAEQREPALQNMLLQFELLRADESIAAGLARYALAQTQFELGAYREVGTTLDALEARWPGERRADDAFWDSVAAMREASLLLFGAEQAGRLGPAQAERLDAIIERLRARPDGKATHDLLQRARARTPIEPA